MHDASPIEQAKSAVKYIVHREIQTGRCEVRPVLPDGWHGDKLFETYSLEAANFICEALTARNAESKEDYYAMAGDVLVDGCNFSPDVSDRRTAGTSDKTVPGRLDDVPRIPEYYRFLIVDTHQPLLPYIVVGQLQNDPHQTQAMCYCATREIAEQVKKSLELARFKGDF